MSKGIKGYSARVIAVLITLVVGILAANSWRLCFGHNVLAVPNIFRPQPIIGQPAGAPLSISGAGFYTYVTSSLSPVTLLHFRLKNKTDKTVHSFTVSYQSKDPLDTSSCVVTPGQFQPGQSVEQQTAVVGRDQVTLRVDCVLFTDGTTWLSNGTYTTVSEDDFRKGEKAASDYLRGILEVSGPTAVINELPNLHNDVRDEESRNFGFYNGVEDIALQLRYAYQQNGPAGIKPLLSRE